MKKQKIVIAGSGSAHTPEIIQLLLDNCKRFPISEIRLYDIDKERNKDMRVLVDYLLKSKNQENINLIVTENPEIAFKDIDFVFSQIRAGGMKMREKDEKIPLKFGLVGQETCGLGGFSYGLRSIKSFLPLVEDILTYSPDAWILNYTNPESIIAEAVRRKFPQAKIINACDMTIGLEEALAKNFGYQRKNWIVNYYGLNHFGWYESIYDVEKKKDVLPDILKDLVTFGIDVPYLESSWQKTYKMMEVMAKDFPDFISNTYLTYYLYPELAMEDIDPNYTRANQIMDGRLKILQEQAEMIRHNPNQKYDNLFEENVHSQYIVDIAIALLHNDYKRMNLIVPNNGAISNLRDDAVVEIPVYVNAKGIEPISFNFKIPDFHKGLMEAQVASEKLLVDAYFENSYQKALEAFSLNQTVPSVSVAKDILNEMIEVNGDLWPDLK